MTDADRREPRWPAALALLAVGGLRFALPESLSVGPEWLLIAVVLVLIIPLTWARYRGMDRLNQILGYVITSVVTVDMVWSLYLLIAALPSHKEAPPDLLRSAAVLWLINILVFASWYWRLDAGGPRARELRGVHTDGAFLFPQMALDQQAKRQMGEQCWEPRLCRLSLFGLQYQHSVLAYGCACALAMGQGADDGAGSDFVCYGGAVGGKSSEYSLRKMRFSSVNFRP
jgi:hypothetical protein